jgi:hypothetical protein
VIELRTQNRCIFLKTNSGYKKWEIIFKSTPSILWVAVVERVFQRGFEFELCVEEWASKYRSHLMSAPKIQELNFQEFC